MSRKQTGKVEGPSPALPKHGEGDEGETLTVVRVGDVESGDMGQVVPGEEAFRDVVEEDQDDEQICGYG